MSYSRKREYLMVNVWHIKQPCITEKINAHKVKTNNFNFNWLLLRGYMVTL